MIDPRFLCSHTERGQRCANPGTLTTSTMNRGQSGKGEEGPWYCAQHFPPFRTRGATTARTPPTAAALAFKDKPQQHDGKDWARRILDRHSQGERLPSISIASAREALGLTPERQPGEDDA